MENGGGSWPARRKPVEAAWATEVRWRQPGGGGNSEAARGWRLEASRGGDPGPWKRSRRGEPADRSCRGGGGQPGGKATWRRRLEAAPAEMSNGGGQPGHGGGLAHPRPPAVACGSEALSAEGKPRQAPSPSHISVLLGVVMALTDFFSLTDAKPI